MSGLPLLHPFSSLENRCSVHFYGQLIDHLGLKHKRQALSAIPTPSECSLVSFCTSDHESDSEEEIIYENVEPRENCPSRESISEHSIQEPHNSFVDSSLESDRLSLAPVYAEMEDQVSQLCRAVE